MPELSSLSSSARAVIIYKHTDTVRIGQCARYHISYRINRTDLENGLEPAQLDLTVKNIEIPVKKIFYLLGPFSIYAQVLPHNYNELLELNVEPDDESIIQLNPNIHAGSSFHAELKLNGNSMVKAGGNNSTVEFQWRLDILSQALLSEYVKVNYTISISKETSEESNDSLKLNTNDETTNELQIHKKNNMQNDKSFNLNSGLGSLLSLMPRTGSPSKTLTSMSNSTSLKSPSTPPTPISERSVNNGNLNVTVQSCQDIWNKPPPHPSEPVHLIILTHGVYSNVGSDLLYLKDKLEAGSSNDDANIMIRGYHGNVAHTEKGIKWLGINLANFVDSLINNTDFNIDRISFVGHSLGGVIQSFAIYYLLNYEGYKTGDIKYFKHPSNEYNYEVNQKIIDENSFTGSNQSRPRRLLKNVQPVNFITLASPLLGTQSEFANLINFGLEVGSLGKTGKDLSLRNRYFSNFTLRKDEKSTHMLLKPLLEIIPLDLKFHFYLRSFKNRVVFANVLNDGIVPLKTSALLYLDYQSLSVVEHLKILAREHENSSSKLELEEAQRFSKQNYPKDNSSEGLNNDIKKEKEHRFARLRQSVKWKQQKNPNKQVGMIPEDSTGDSDARDKSANYHLSNLLEDKTQIPRYDEIANAEGSQENADPDDLEYQFQKANRKGDPSATLGVKGNTHNSSFIDKINLKKKYTFPLPVNSLVPKSSSEKLTKRQKRIMQLQTISKKADALKGGKSTGDTESQMLNPDYSSKDGGLEKNHFLGSKTDGVLFNSDRINQKIYAPPQSSSIISAINTLIAPTPKKDFFKNYKPIKENDVSGLLEKMQSELSMNDNSKCDEAGGDDHDLQGKPSNTSFYTDMIDNGVIVHDKTYTYEELPEPYLNKVGATRRLSVLYHTISNTSKPGETRKMLRLSDLTHDILQPTSIDIPFLYKSKKSNILAKKHFKSKQLAEKIARLYLYDKPWRKVLVNLKPDAHNNIIVRRQFVNSYGWNVINYLVLLFDYEGEIDQEQSQIVEEGKANIDKLENVHYDASISPLGSLFRDLVKSPFLKGGDENGEAASSEEDDGNESASDESEDEMVNLLAG